MYVFCVVKNHLDLHWTLSHICITITEPGNLRESDLFLHTGAVTAITENSLADLLMIQWHNCVMPLILNTTSPVHTCLNQMEKQRILINSSNPQSENYAKMINKVGIKY